MEAPGLSSLLGFFGLFALGLAVYLSVLIGFTMWRLTRPPRRTYASAVARGLAGDPSELDTPRRFEAWALAPRGRRLEAWTIQGDDPAGPVCVMAPGWGDGRVGALTRLDALTPGCSRIVAFDSAGLGESEGVCTLGTREVGDLVALIERVREEGRSLVVYGWSLGAGMAIAAAALGTPVDAIIAEAPYRRADTPARNVMHGAGLPWRANLAPAIAMLGASFGVGIGWRGFDRAELAQRVACPILVLHGSEDEICPVEDGREIATRAPAGELFVIPGGRHNDLWMDERHRAVCVEAVRGFVERVSGMVDTQGGRSLHTDSPQRHGEHRESHCLGKPEEVKRGGI
ncbi:MAG: alpha/beta fold hydrolase [Phycisphaerales bacterium]